MFRRISLFGGPGCGKSTLASWLYGQLKMEGQDIELIREWVKEWAYMDIKIHGYDQLFIFAHQLRREELVLRNGVEMLITDSPVFLPVCYSKKYEFKDWESLANISKTFDEEYPSLNIFLGRDGIEYVDKGRYESYNEALEVDRMIHTAMRQCGMEVLTMNARNKEEILKTIRHMTKK